MMSLKSIFDVDSLGIVILYFTLFSLYRCAFCHALFTINDDDNDAIADASVVNCIRP